MNNFNIILEKLEAFIKRFYINELLKGAILFFSIGFLYFLFTLFIEYALWLNTSFRAILFWLFIAVELGLFVNFIAIPLAKLFKVQSGIDYKEASKLIGKHFPEVNDKLLNVLQLQESTSRSELLLASIEQKSFELSPIPFKLAVNFKNNVKYLKYAAIPVLILLFTFFTGNFDWFSTSYQRVINYKTAYEPPAPFQFYVLNSTLNALENKDFKLIVKTAGSFVPENAQIVYNNETYFLQQTGVGEFEYVFSQPKADIEFQLSANDVLSKPYTLQVIDVPSIVNFKMVLNYPKYTKKTSQVLKSTGNAIVPEGTSISWQLLTKSTDQVYLKFENTVPFTHDGEGLFSAKKSVYNDFDYSLTTSNKLLKDYESLAFHIDVVKDEFPEISVDSKVDTLDQQTLYFHGKINDDYGFSNLQLVYYPSDNESDKKAIKIPVSDTNIFEFVSAFPNNLKLKEGVAYNLYFQVADNDAVNKFKVVKSRIFNYRKRTQSEEIDKQLQEQKESVNDLNKSLERFDEQQEKLKELSKIQKEKTRLDFNDKKKLETFFKRQEQQDELMKKFNEKLKNNLEEFKKDNPKQDQFQKDLQKRLEENEQKLKQDEKLLEELKKLQDKINKEQLVQKLDELAKENKNKKRSLEQILELTKRFYVEKKLEKLKDDLENLAEKQEKLSNEPKESNTKEKQDQLNKKFDDFKKEMDNLQKESQQLKKPMDIPRDKLDEKEVDQEQQKASDNLEKNQSDSFQKAQQNQKGAASKMKQMAKAMKMPMGGGGGGMQMQEDVEMLRQILDNLLLFSFRQEALMKDFSVISFNHNKYASYLRRQSHLKEHFEHVDDSLFALSLRQPKISEKVNNEVSDVYYNIDKALSQFADSQLYQGLSNQQFVVTAANNLADFLSEVLDNLQMQMSMSASGKGSSGDMQLPDIIMSQDQLNKMMQEGMKQGKEGQSGEGQGKEQGEKPGDKEGNKGDKNGKQGDKGNGGTGGHGDQNGESTEENNALLYEIYQKQQELRQALEEHLNKSGFGSKANASALLKQMENIELDLLNKGFTNQTLSKMMALKHQLLKLEKASFEQGQEMKRESNTNKYEFDNNSNNQIPNAKKYFNVNEILNRQSLPLRQIYRRRVTDYFKEDHD